MITFSTAMNTATLDNSGELRDGYRCSRQEDQEKARHDQADTRQVQRDGSTSNTVTLKPAGTPFTKKAGEIILSTALESAAGASLGSTETLSIAKGGKRITLA